MRQSSASPFVPLTFCWLCTQSKQGRVKGSSVLVLPVKWVTCHCVSLKLWKTPSTTDTWENCCDPSIYVVQWLFCLISFAPCSALQKLFCSQHVRHFVLHSCSFVFTSVALLIAMPQ